jgi:hypothetical protein
MLMLPQMQGDAAPLTRDGAASGAWYEFDAQDPVDGSSFTFNVRASRPRVSLTSAFDALCC